MKAAILLVALGLVAAAPAVRPADTASIVAIIKDCEARQNANFAARDVQKIVAFFAPDASVILPNAPVMTGGKALSEGIGAALSDPNFALTFASDQVYVAASRDLAVARGWYRQSGTDPASHKAVTTTGTYVTVFRPQPDGSWKGVWDIVTPGPGAAPAK